MLPTMPTSPPLEPQSSAAGPVSPIDERDSDLDSASDDALEGYYDEYLCPSFVDDYGGWPNTYLSSEYYPWDGGRDFDAEAWNHGGLSPLYPEYWDPRRGASCTSAPTQISITTLISLGRSPGGDLLSCQGVIWMRGKEVPCFDMHNNCNIVGKVGGSRPASAEVLSWKNSVHGLNSNPTVARDGKMLIHVESIRSTAKPLIRRVRVPTVEAP